MTGTSMRRDVGIRYLTDADAVLSALREFDDVGQKSFLVETHGFRSSTRYYLQHPDCRYDPKAIAGVAHGYQHGKSLAYNDFPGGEASTNAVLRLLGFTVLSGIPSTTRRNGSGASPSGRTSAPGRTPTGCSPPATRAQ
ncbi:hypothetical protein [Kitasatospora sp. NPDC085879]|uniref:hypothetical protein n=1 Tax=Kitasatospora sp. NPDC085879 TaxID=3154769 RepID=UPI0034153A67